MVDIRKAEIADVDEVYKLGRSIEASKVNEDTVTFWPKKILSKIVESSTDVFLVAEEDGGILGYIIVSYNPSFGKATIENIFVGEARNQGVGSALLDEAIEILKERGCEYICTFNKIKEKDTTAWFAKRGIRGSEKFFWLDRVLDKTFSG